MDVPKQPDPRQVKPDPDVLATGFEPALHPSTEGSQAPELGGVGNSVARTERLVSQLVGQRLARVRYVYGDYPYSPGETDWNTYSKELDVADAIELIAEAGLKLSLSVGTAMERSEERAGYFNTGIQVESELQPPESADDGTVVIDVTSSTRWSDIIGDTITEVRCYRGIGLTIESRYQFPYIQTVEITFESERILALTCADYDRGKLRHLGSHLFSVFSDASARRYSVGRYSTENARLQPKSSGYWI